MKNLGILIMFLGILLLTHAFTMDTTVKVDYQGNNQLNLPERVNNIGLMDDKHNYMILGGILAILGVLIYDKKSKTSK